MSQTAILCLLHDHSGIFQGVAERTAILESIRKMKISLAPPRHTAPVFEVGGKILHSKQSLVVLIHTEDGEHCLILSQAFLPLTSSDCHPGSGQDNHYPSLTTNVSVQTDGSFYSEGCLVTVRVRVA